MAEKTSLRIGFLLMIACTIFTSAGQLLWKAGSLRISFSNLLTFFNLPFVAGCGLYVIGSLLMILALKKGELSVLYPVVATSYVWVGLLAPVFFLGDSLNPWKLTGILVILASITLLGWGSTRQTIPTQLEEKA